MECRSEGRPTSPFAWRNASSVAECSGEVALFGKARIQRDIHQGEATIDKQPLGALDASGQMPLMRLVPVDVLKARPNCEGDRSCHDRQLGQSYLSGGVILDEIDDRAKLPRRQAETGTITEFDLGFRLETRAIMAATTLSPKSVDDRSVASQPDNKRPRA